MNVGRHGYLEKAIRRKYRVKLEIGYPGRKDSRSAESEQGISAKCQEEEE
jgi:hypothetical protein